MRYMIRDVVHGVLNFVDDKTITTLPTGATALTDAEWLNRHLIEPAEIARAKRNKLIAQSDWSALADAPLTAAQKTAWKAYRQALRDITIQPDFPLAIVWPTIP